MDAVLPGAKPAFREDSSMVVAPALLLIRTATKLLATRFAVCFLGAAALAAGSARFVLQAAGTTALTTVSNLCWVATAPTFAWPRFSLRNVTRDDGQLKTLGLGSTKILAKAVKRLKRWHVPLLRFSAFTVLTYGLSTII